MFHQFRALRSPRPAHERDAIQQTTGIARIGLAARADDATCLSALGQLAGDSDGRTTLILPSRSVGPRLSIAAIRWLATTSAVILALPSGVPRQRRRRWKLVAGMSGVPILTLGDQGWDRVWLGDGSEIMGYVDLPAEFRACDEVVVLDSGAASITSTWREIVHPNSALRARVSGEAGDAELSLAVGARYIRRLDSGTDVTVVVECGDRVATQLVVSAWLRVREQERGIEAPGPWEDETVQSLVRLGGGIALPSQMMIEADVDDSYTESCVRRVAEILGCHLELRTGSIDRAAS